MRSTENERSNGESKKSLKKVLTPGIEPGLSKPQSDVLPLYYVSFLSYSKAMNI